MFTQLEKEVSYVRREGFWAVPIENSDGGASVNNRIPKMDFGRREVEHWGDAKGDEAKGLKMREGSPLKIMICTNEERRGGETCIKGREWPIIWTMHELA